MSTKQPQAVSVPSLKMSLESILENQPPNLPQARVSGNFTDAIELIIETSMSAVFSMGRPLSSDEAMLLPHVQLDIGGAAPTENGEKPPTQPFLSKLLPLENAAYLVVQLAADFHGLARELGRFEDNDLKPEKLRVMHARYLLAHAARECLSAVARLNILLASYPVEGEPRRSERAAKAKPNASKPVRRKRMAKPSAPKEQ